MAVSLLAESVLPGQHRFLARVPGHAASTATESFPIDFQRQAIALVSATHVPDQTITGADTNSTSLELVNVGTAGVGTAELANRDYLNGTDTTALDGGAFTMAATLTVAAGSVIVLRYTKVGAGLAIPAGFIEFIYTITYWAGARESR